MPSQYYNHEPPTGSLTPTLWDGFDVVRATFNPGYGFYRNYDFIGDYILDSSTWEPLDWTPTQATSGSLATAAGDGGVMLIDTGATTAGQGMQMQHGGSTYIDFSTHRAVRMEMRCTWAAITTGPQFFFGLGLTDTSFISGGASPTNSSADSVGLVSLSGGTITGTSRVTTGSVTGTATLTGSAATISTTTAQYGMLITPKGASFWLDGVKETDQLTSTEISAVAMRPTLVVQSNGTTQPTLTVDWIAIGLEK